MFTAIDNSGNKIEAKNAIKNNLYKCPVCEQEVNPRILGKIKAPYFAHKNNCKCTDSWDYDMSEWHISWQEKYPICNREVVMTADGKTHRADICIGKYVIEFQHSKITPDEVKERNDFYNKCGYKVVWVFDMIERYEKNQIYKEVYNNDYIYKWAFDSLKYVVPQNNNKVIICFQISNEEILHVYNAENWLNELEADYGKFSAYCDGIDLLSNNSIDSMFNVIQKGIEKRLEREETKRTEEARRQVVNAKYAAGLYDECIYYLGKDNRYRQYPCFKEEKLYAINCMFCEHWGIGKENGGCTYRFRDISPEDVLEIIRDEKGYILKIKLKDNKIVYFEKVKSLCRTLCEIWKIYGPLEIARVRNIRTNKYAHIKTDPNVQLEKFGAIRGKISSDGRNFSTRHYDIFNADKREWMMEWFIKK